MRLSARQSLNPKKLVLLDRDGVINIDSDAYIKSPEEWHAIPGSLEAIAKLNHAGIKVCIITNQSGIGRGYFDKNTLDAMHEKLQQELMLVGGEISDIFFCPHTPDEKCLCRKPNVGMLEQLEEKYNISVKDVPFIGDTNKDIELAHRKNCLAFLVKTGKGQKYYNEGFQKSAWLNTTKVFDNLLSVSNHLLEQHF